MRCSTGGEVMENRARFEAVAGPKGFAVVATVVGTVLVLLGSTHRTLTGRGFVILSSLAVVWMFCEVVLRNRRSFTRPVLASVSLGFAWCLYSMVQKLW